MAKRGRPKLDDEKAKRTGIRFRLRQDQADRLCELSKKTNMNRTDLFISWLNRAYDELDKKC